LIPFVLQLVRYTTNVKSLNAFPLVLVVVVGGAVARSLSNLPNIFSLSGKDGPTTDGRHNPFVALIFFFLCLYLAAARRATR
jgi:hypothetical protein